jgi:protein-ribulosamine 3-kinase
LLQVGPLPSGGSFIIMGFIEFGRSRGDQVTLPSVPIFGLAFFLNKVKKNFCRQSVLGRRLAEMHKAAKSDKGYGFYVDNTIGS